MLILDYIILVVISVSDLCSRVESVNKKSVVFLADFFTISKRAMCMISLYTWEIIPGENNEKV